MGKATLVPAVTSTTSFLLGSEVCGTSYEGDAGNAVHQKTLPQQCCSDEAFVLIASDKS